MNSEGSHHDIVALRNANSSLESQLREIRDELRKSFHQQELRNIERSGEMERSLTKWAAVMIVISIAFTLVVTHERPAEKESSAVAATALSEDS